VSPYIEKLRVRSCRSTALLDGVGVSSRSLPSDESMSKILLRRAESGDAKDLLTWVNSPESLAQKEKTTAPIGWQEHLSWFEKKLAGDDGRIYMIEEGGALIGQVRLEPLLSGVAIDIFIVPEARKRGNAQRALLAAIVESDTRPIIARVKCSNYPSRRLFEATGFSQSSGENNFVTYELHGDTGSDNG
jgi:RimJ/RimL family protein N-acetyltransferase